MDRLPSELHRRIFSYLDLSALLNSVDVSIEWRQIIEYKSINSDQSILSTTSFLDQFCQRRFGLKLEDLPPPSRYEKLLLDTQRLCSRESVDTQFLETPKDLLKLYAMELRSSWFPYGFKFDGNGDEIIENIKTRKLVFPLASDYGKIDLALEAKFRKLSARIHAGVPGLWKMCACGLLGNMSEQLRSMSHAWMTRLIDKTPEQIDVILPEIMPDIRQLCDFAEPRMVEILGIRHRMLKCPNAGPLSTSQESIHAFQIKMVEHLDETIRSIGFLLSREIRNRLESAGRNTPDMLESIGQHVRKLFDCEIMRTSDPHQCSRKKSSESFNVLLIRALRRGINSYYVEEVKSLFAVDPLLFQLVHCWSFQGKGHNGDLCTDFFFDYMEHKHKEVCRMHISVNNWNLMCNRCGHPELWPAVMLKKAVGDVAKVGLEIQKEVEKFIGL